MITHRRPGRATCILLGLCLALACQAQETAKRTETEVTADKLEYDMKHSTATFTGNVHVQDPEITIRADSLVVLFDKESQIERALASGSVKIEDGRAVATCDKAAYGVKKGQVILNGNARLVRDKDSVTGDRITFWLREDRMICEPGRLVIFPKRGSKTP